MKHIDLKQLAGPELPAVGQEYLETVRAYVIYIIMLLITCFLNVWFKVK